MNILHLLYAGGTGGIEKLCKDIGMQSVNERNIFVFVHEGGVIYEEMKSAKMNTLLLQRKNKDIVTLYKDIVDLVKKNDIDCINVHHAAPLIWLSVLLYILKNKSHKKVIIYAHNNYDEIVKYKIQKSILYNILLNRCDHVIAISNYVKDSILKRSKINDNKITVVYNGVNTKEYITERDKVVCDPIRLIYVGRLIQPKGVQVLLDALTLVENLNDYSLSIIGDGVYREQLERQCNKLGLDQIVTFNGNQRNIKEQLANADIFVHPAIWEEGFGITIIEAMSSKLVCVAFRKGAIPEIIENNISGYIVEDCSASALALKLDEIKNNIKKDNLMSVREAAFERTKKFSIEALLANLHNVYVQLLEATKNLE